MCEITKDCFFEKINTMYKLLARMIKKKREAQMINIRNKTENDTTDPTDIKMMIEENKNIMPLGQQIAFSKYTLSE